ncbi:amidase [Rhodovarius crocodyli]|uniref:Amidase n=1 Tax=Rhodovarius crocodyli TaxID=1979269 RepID=A0A437MNC8_9PROT|nr:amidase [Rhodovarius crocodyli]RVT99154.1 amidase [Rhodovarius crocodyli]
MQPHALTAAEAAAQIRAGSLTAEALLRSCLERIEAREPVTRAFLHLDVELALRRARELDKRQAFGAAMGPLHGLPFAVKDVFDTKDMPTTLNSPIYEGFQAGRDAAAVAVVRALGALIIGKADTVEFASTGRKALSTNPYNARHTPGGSSSGSAAAVGDFMAPLSFGTQTAGSLIRPASFCGIYGMKPSWQLVSREGLKNSSATLDTVGWYGRSVADLALVASAYGVVTPEAPSVRGLRVGLCRSPVWNRIEPSGEAALSAAAQRLERAGAIVTDLTLPGEFAGLPDARTLIGDYEGGAAFLPEALVFGDAFAPALRSKATDRAKLSTSDVMAAYNLADACRPRFDALFGAELDVVLTPAAPGEAPEGLHTVGDWVFNGMWTLLHVPCVGIPCTRGPAGLPVGVQLVGPRLNDARLLAIASACAPVIDEDPEFGRRTLLG